MLVEQRARIIDTHAHQPGGISRTGGEGGGRARQAESERGSVDPRSQVVNALQDTLSLLQNIPVSVEPKEVAKKVIGDPAFKKRKSGELQSYRIKKFGDGKFRANEGIILNEMFSTARASMDLLSRRDRERLVSNLEILENNSKKYLDRGKRRKPEQHEARVRQEAKDRGIAYEAAKRLIDERIELVLPSNRRKAVSSNSHVGGERAHQIHVSRTQRSGHHPVRRPERASKKLNTITPTETVTRDELKQPQLVKSKALDPVLSPRTNEVVAQKPPRMRYRDRLRRFFGKKDEVSKRRRRRAVAGLLGVVLAGPEVYSTVRSMQADRNIIPSPIVRTVKNIPNVAEQVLASPVVVNGKEIRLKSQQAAKAPAELEGKKHQEPVTREETVVWQAPEPAKQDLQVAPESPNSNINVAKPEVVVQNTHPKTDLAETIAAPQPTTTIPRRERGVPVVRQPKLEGSITAIAPEQIAPISEPSVTIIAPKAAPVTTQVVAPEPIPTPEPPPAPEPEPSTEAGKLAKKILNHPNISFDSSYPRILRSVQDVVEDGRTFLYDVDHIGVSETDVDPQLLSVILDLANNGIEVIITSLTTGKHSAESAHYIGHGIDLGFKDRDGYQKAFNHLYFNSEHYKINELIWGGNLPAGTENLKWGIPFPYTPSVVSGHVGHIHLSTL